MHSGQIWDTWAADWSCRRAVKRFVAFGKTGRYTYRAVACNEAIEKKCELASVFSVSWVYADRERVGSRKAVQEYAWLQQEGSLCRVYRGKYRYGLSVVGGIE